MSAEPAKRADVQCTSTKPFGIVLKSLANMSSPIVTLNCTCVNIVDVIKSYLLNFIHCSNFVSDFVSDSNLRAQ